MTDHDKVTEATRAHLDRSLDDLDPKITERLAARREKALQAASMERRGMRRTPMAIAGVAASVVMAAVLVTFSGGTDAPQQTPEDIELMAAEEPLEFYQDLEFYLWLEQQDLDELAQTGAGST